jgi:hypothetical protein
MTLKYINIFPSKALQNLPTFGFWFEKKPSGNPAPNAARNIRTNLRLYPTLTDPFGFELLGQIVPTFGSF